jgi:hypothetical protein
MITTFWSENLNVRDHLENLRHRWEDNNKKFLEELIAYLPLIRHEQRRKKMGGYTDTEN